jgi:hypothetical protein
MAAISVTTTPQAILLTGNSDNSLPSNDARLYVQNRGPAEVFFGPTAAVTAASGVGLAAGATLEHPDAKYGAGYDLFMVTAAGTADVRWVMI